MAWVISCRSPCVSRSRLAPPRSSIDESPTAVPPGRILDVRYFTDSTSIFQMPAGLAGLTTEASEYVRVNLTSSKVGVAIALSFRKACNTFDGPGGAHPRPVVPAPGFPTGTGSNCFEDGYGRGRSSTCDARHRQRALQPASGCRDADRGLLLRDGVAGRRCRTASTSCAGTGRRTVGAAPPEVKSAYLEDVMRVSTTASAPRTSTPSRSLDCKARLTRQGRYRRRGRGHRARPGVNNQQTRIADNIEVRYKHVDASGNVLCNFGPNCALQHAVAGTRRHDHVLHAGHGQLAAP